VNLVLALDERPDRGAAQGEDQITLPVSGHRPVLSLGRALGYQDLIGHELLAAIGRGAVARLGTRVRARGTRSALPVRRHAASSRRSAPRPCTYSD
jgi:hypothetical protein